MFEDIDKSMLTEYAPSLKRLNLEEDFKNSGYTDREEYKRSMIKDKVSSSNSRSDSKQDLPYTIDRNIHNHETPSSQKNSTIQSKRYDGSSTNFKYIGEKSNKPYIDKRIPVQKTSFFDKIKKKYTDYVGKVADRLPTYKEDQLRAAFNNIDVRPTMMGRLTGLFGMSEFEGYNRISKQGFNIDFTSGFDDKTYEYWKQMQREETSKYVRNLGDSIDPFTKETPSEYGRQAQYVNELGRTDTSDMSTSELHNHRANLNLERNKLDGMTPVDNRMRDSKQLAEINKRIDQTKNDFKQFFNPMDKKELDMLQSTHTELTERMRRYDGHYNSSLINQEELKSPASIKESFKDLYERRAQIASQIKENGPARSNVYKERVAQSLWNQQHAIDREIAAKASSEGFGNDFVRPVSSSTLGRPDHVKDSYRPTYGTSGYGLGSNAMKASRIEHLARFGHYLNPFGAGGESGLQALKESFGIMNKQQKLLAKQAKGLGRITHNIVPIAAAGMLFSDMMDHKGPGEIIEDFVSMGGALHGWRTGSALGGALNIGQKTKFLGLGVGGAVGAATGYLIGAAVVGGINDITTNDSGIRKFAKKLGTKESLVTSPDTRQSLTARQQSLQKLAKSGLNDRSLLLGNESSILAGLV